MSVPPPPEGFDPETQDRIIAAIKERVGPTLRCPMCGRNEFELQNGAVVLVLQQNPAASLALGGYGLPLVAMECAHCGATQLFNLIVIGLNDIFEPQLPAPP